MRPGGDTRRRIESAVTLLPQPDSPTRPSVRPRRSVKLMPSTARATPSEVSKCVCSSRTARRGGAGSRARGAASVTAASATSSTHPERARIEGVAQIIAEEVERHDCDEDKDAGRQDPGELRDALHVLRVGEEVAPAGARLLDAESEERQRALAEDEARDAERGGDDRVAERGGNHVAHDDARAAGTERARALHVLELANRRHHAA